MLHLLNEFIHINLSFSTPRRIFLLLGVYVFFITLLLPLITVHPPFDMSIDGYAYEEMMPRMAAMTSTERYRYAIGLWTLDTAYPICYAFLLSALLTYPVKKIEYSSKIVEYLSLIPWLPATLDICENAFITASLITYPNTSLFIVDAALLLTKTKWVFIFTIVVITILANIICWPVVWSRFIKERHVRGNQLEK